MAKEDELRQELERGARALVEAVEKSREKPVDDFDRLRILETAFNRLFMAVEHISNALVLAEHGSISKRHFGNVKQLDGIRKKYGLPDIPRLYEESYSLRSYADYRKHPEISGKFNQENLGRKIGEVRAFLEKGLIVLSKYTDTSAVEDYIKKFS